jgi:hypothetical protein
MFMPSPGVLGVLVSRVRHAAIDSGYREGDQVTPYYDPLIAKIIAWGRPCGRDHNAAEALRRACEASRPIGVPGAARKVSRGRATTRFIDERGSLLSRQPNLALRPRRPLNSSWPGPHEMLAILGAPAARKVEHGWRKSALRLDDVVRGRSGPCP